MSMFLQLIYTVFFLHQTTDICWWLWFNAEQTSFHLLLSKIKFITARQVLLNSALNLCRLWMFQTPSTATVYLYRLFFPWQTWLAVVTMATEWASAEEVAEFNTVQDKVRKQLSNRVAPMGLRSWQQSLPQHLSFGSIKLHLAAAPWHAVYHQIFPVLLKSCISCRHGVVNSLSLKMQPHTLPDRRLLSPVYKICHQRTLHQAYESPLAHCFVYSLCIFYYWVIHIVCI